MAASRPVRTRATNNIKFPLTNKIGLDSQHASAALASFDCTALVFDLDGTLIDSRQDLADAANRTLRAHGLPSRTTEEIVSFVGDGARMLMAHAASLAPDSADLDAVLRTFLEDYRANALVHTRLLPGVAEVLPDLLGRFPLALCTNKPRSSTLPILDGLQIAQLFRVVVCGDDLPEKKPDPRPLRFIAEQLAVPVEGCAMVGDGPQDVRAARAAGMLAIAVAGMANLKALRDAKPDVFLTNIRELRALLT